MGLVAVAVGVRLLYWLATIDYSPTSDAHSYHSIGRNLARGIGFAAHFPALSDHATAFRPPIFPLLLAGPYRLFGASVGLGRLTSLLVGIVVVLLVERLTSKIGGSIAGLVAAVAVAIYPPLVVNDVSILAEGLSLLLIVLIITAIAEERWLLAGIETGLLVLTRHSAQLYALVVAILLLRWLGWKRALGYLGVSVLVVVPWLIRNDIQMGSPVLNTANGFNLAAAYSVEAHDDNDFVDPVFDERFSELRLVQFDEIAWDRALRDRGLDGLRGHPLEPVRVMRRNLMYYFELKPWENDDAEELDGRNLTIRHITLPLFYAVTVAGVAGLWLARRNRTVALIGITAAYFSLASILTVSSPRLRAPFDLACCIGVGLLVGRCLQGRRPSVGAAQPGASQG